jgi:hypothetical protein
MFIVDLVSGMCAGALGAAVTQPLDALKTRLQVGRLYSFAATDISVSPASSSSVASAVEVVHGANNTRSVAVARPQSSAGGGSGSGAIFTVLRDMLREEGVVPLFRGVWGRVLWVAPGTGITVAVFRFVDSLLSQY